MKKEKNLMYFINAAKKAKTQYGLLLIIEKADKILNLDDFCTLDDYVTLIFDTKAAL